MSMALDDKQQGHDDHQLPELAEPRSTAEVAEALAASGMVDELLAQIDTGQVQITGDGGLIPGLIKLALERGLKAELTDHLGYDKGDPAGRELPNARNGSTPKTVASEAGPVELNVPRDRDGTFTPRLVPKGSRRLGGLDDIIILNRPGSVGGSRTCEGWRAWQHHASTVRNSRTGPPGWHVKRDEIPIRREVRSSGSPISSESIPRRCAIGFVRPRSTAGSARAPRVRTLTASRRWSGRTVNCGERTRS